MLNNSSPNNKLGLSPKSNLLIVQVNICSKLEEYASSSQAFSKWLFWEKERLLFHMYPNIFQFFMILNRQEAENWTQKTIQQIKAQNGFAVLAGSL